MPKACRRLMQNVNCEPTARWSGVPLPVPVLVWVLESSVLYSHLQLSSAASMHLSSMYNKTEWNYIEKTTTLYNNQVENTMQWTERLCVLFNDSFWYCWCLTSTNLHFCILYLTGFFRFLTGEHHVCQVNGRLTSTSATNQSIVQGSVIGPLLCFIKIMKLDLRRSEVWFLLMFHQVVPLYFMLPINVSLLHSPSEAYSVLSSISTGFYK